MSKLLIIGPGEKAKAPSTDMLIAEAKKHFDTDYFRLIDAKLGATREGVSAFFDGTNVKEYSYVIPKIDSRRASFGYYVIRTLDAMGIPKPYPAETIQIAHNKFVTLEVLAKHGIPVPATYMTASKSAVNEVLKKMKFPLVMKILAGYGGKGVMIADSSETARSVADTMKMLQEEVLIEEFIESGEDIRAFVVGNEVVASMMRTASAKKGEFRANIASGGKAAIHKITPEETEIALKSARAIKADICAIDMMYTKSGPVVVEVNINPGLQGITKATNINIAEKIVQFVRTQVKS